MRHHEPAASMAMNAREYRVMYEIEEDYWWYRGLRVLLDRLLDRYLPEVSGCRVLDAGCGTGTNLKLLLERSRAIGVDISPDAIEFCRMRNIPGEKALIASILELPFPTGFFDLAFSFDVICNIEDDVSAFAEIRRVCRPGGRLIAQLPAFRSLWSAHDDAVGHKHRYSAADLRRKVEQAGFQVERVNYLNAALFPFEVAARLIRRGESGDHARSDLTPLPRPVNAVLSLLFEAEMRAANRFRFPYGLSLLVVARKD